MGSGVGNGCVVLILTASLLLGLTMWGGAALIDSLADWRHAGSIVQVAEQETEQTRIEWNARTEIASIQADATKKTSGAFVGFWALRFAVWTLGIVAAVVWAWIIWKLVLSRMFS